MLLNRFAGFWAPPWLLRVFTPLVILLLVTNVAEAKGRKSHSKKQHAQRPSLEASSLAMLPATGAGASEALVAQAVSGMVAYAQGPLKLKPIANDKVTHAVSKAQLQALASCGATTCAAATEVETALGAENVVVPSVSQTAGGIDLSLVGYSGQSGKVLGSGTVHLKAAGELDEAARDLTHLVFKHEPRDAMGYVRIVAEEGATLQVDGQSVGTSPLPLRLRLKGGPHAVHAEKAGFIPFSGQVDVVAGAEAQVDAKMLAEPPPPPVVTPPVTAAPRKGMSAGRIAGVTLGAVGLAALAAGAGLAVVANQHAAHAHSVIQSATVEQNELNTANNQITGANALFGIGGALAVAGAGLVIAF